MKPTVSFVSVHQGLSLCQVSRETAGKTLGSYFFEVHCGGSVLAGFNGKQDFLRWIEERGLKLSEQLAPVGEIRLQALIGRYAEVMHSDCESFDGINPLVTSRMMENGSFTLTKITQRPSGTRVVHYLNCNLRRREFGYRESQAMFA